MKNIELPILLHGNEPTSEFGGVASINGSMGNIMASKLANLIVECTEFEKIIASAEKIISVTKKETQKEKSIEVDSVSFNIGISNSGRVGFMGSGIGVDCIASFQITFKVPSSNE